jgi:hypothetical protein
LKKKQPYYQGNLGKAEVSSANRLSGEANLKLVLHSTPGAKIQTVCNKTGVRPVIEMKGEPK